MADLRLGIIIRAVDKLTAPVRKITKSTERMTEAVRRAERPARNLGNRQRDLQGRFVRTTDAIQKQTHRLRIWGGAAQEALGRARRLSLRAGVGFAGLAYGFKRMIDTTAEFERLETVLKTIEGSSEKARESMQWIERFTRKTPFELREVGEGFKMLRAYGLNPTDGLLRTLGDTAAAMGKPLMQAVEAIADAVTGENERLKEFGIKGSVIKGGKIRYEYTLDGETRFAEALASDRAEIQRVLLEIMNLRYKGGMEELTGTFEGRMSNLWDALTSFSNMVTKSGAFQFINEKLQGLLDKIDQMAGDGSLQQLAERIGGQITDAFKALEQAITQIWPWLVRIGNALSWAAEKMGGWGNLALTLTGLYIAKPFISLTGALKNVVSWSGKALGAVRKLSAVGTASKAATAAAPRGVGALASASGGLFPGAARTAAPAAGGAAPAARIGMLSRLGGIFKGLAAVLGLLSIKFIAIGLVVAAVAGLVYKYWEPIKGFLTGVWEGFTEALQPVIAALGPFFAMIGEWIAPAVQWFKDLFVPVEMTAQELGGFAAAGKAVGAVIGGLILNIGKFVTGLFVAVYKIGDAGVRFVDALIDGIVSGGPKLYETVTGIFAKLRDLLPFSDARKGPLSRLTAAGGAILETMGLGVLRAGPRALQRPLAQTLGTAAAGLALGAGAAGAGGSLSAAAPPAAVGAAAPVDQSIHIQQLIINQQPGEDPASMAKRVLREIEAERRLGDREAVSDEL